jgi:hypothetical protein
VGNPNLVFGSTRLQSFPGHVHQAFVYLSKCFYFAYIDSRVRRGVSRVFVLDVIEQRARPTVGSFRRRCAIAAASPISAVSMSGFLWFEQSAYFARDLELHSPPFDRGWFLALHVDLFDFRHTEREDLPDLIDQVVGLHQIDNFPVGHVFYWFHVSSFRTC